MSSGCMGDPPYATRSRVARPYFEFGWRQPCIQRDRDHSQPAARVDQLDVLGLIREEKRQPVPGPKTMPCERRCDPRDAVVKLTEAWARPGRSKRRASRVEPGGPA